MYERTDDKRQTMAASGAPRNPAAILHRSSSVPHPLSSVVRRPSFTLPITNFSRVERVERVEVLDRINRIYRIEKLTLKSEGVANE